MATANYSLAPGQRMVVESAGVGYGTVTQTYPAAGDALDVAVSGKVAVGPFSDQRSFDVVSTDETLLVTMEVPPLGLRRYVPLLVDGAIDDSADDFVGVTFINGYFNADVSTTIHSAVKGRHCRFVATNTTGVWEILPDDQILWPNVAGGGAIVVTTLDALAGSHAVIELEAVEDGTWVVVNNLGWTYT